MASRANCSTATRRRNYAAVDGGSKQRRHEIGDARAGALLHDLGDLAAVTLAGVAFVAEQAHRLLPFHQTDQLFHLRLGALGLEVLGVDAPQRLEIAASRGLAA